MSLNAGATATRLARSALSAASARPASASSHSTRHRRSINSRHSAPYSHQARGKSDAVSDISTPGFKPRPASGDGSTSQQPRQGLTPRVGTAVLTLTLFGIAVTGYGLYEYYTSFSTWPPELRDDLRTALKARNRGDARRAESFFRKALDTARSLKEQGNLGSGSHVLKTSGIAIALATLLEDEGQLVAAYQVYRDALDEVRQQGAFDPVLQARQDGERGKIKIRSSKMAERTGEERMRAVAIAQRMADLAQLDEVRIALSMEEAPNSSKASPSSVRPAVTGTADSPDPAERLLVWSVEELLRLALPEDVRQKALSAAASGSQDPAVSLSSSPSSSSSSGAKAVSEEDKVLIADLKLPPWVTQHEIGAAIEALGAFYAGRGKADYAVPLYLQALSILMPPSSSSARQQATVADRCRAAVLMNNLSQVFAESSQLSATKVAGTDADLVQAKSWASKGLEIADITIRKAGFDGPPPANSSIKQVEQTSEERTRQVRLECLRAQITLLFNLGVMSEMTGDVCDARKYYQRAFKQAQVADLDAAKQRSASALTKLERRSAAAKTPMVQ